MKVYQDIASFPRLDHAVVTPGTFDGVHKGHRKIIDRINALAKERGGESVLFTFHPHPRMVLFPQDHGLQLLNTPEEKLTLLEEAGIDHVVRYPFTKDFSRMSATEYVRDLLVNQLHLGTLVVGYDHHFGRNREGDFAMLETYSETYGFALEQISALDIDEVNVSSTKIRRALLEGEVHLANDYLGYNYALHGEVIHGAGRGKGIGFPTANLQIGDETKLIPKNGVYVAKVIFNGTPFGAMLNIGVNPTVSSTGERHIEVHLLDFAGDLYGQNIEVQILQHLRNEIAFRNVDELKSQLKKDQTNAKRCLESY